MLPLLIWLILFAVFVVLLWAAKGIAGQQSKQQANNQKAVRVQHAEKLNLPQDTVAEVVQIELHVEAPEVTLEESQKEVKNIEIQELVSVDLKPVIEEPHNTKPPIPRQKSKRLKWLFAEILE